MKRKLIVLAAFLGIILWSIFDSYRIDVEWISIEVDNLPLGLDGLRIVHVSDLQLPQNISNLREIIGVVEQIEPDLIFMTGDDIDRTYDMSSGQLEYVAMNLARIATVYAVSGNHEHDNPYFELWREVLVASGVRVLDQDYVFYEGLLIVGLEDGDVFDLNFVPETDLFSILLVHRPEVLDAGFDLIFSGHRHGGQVRIPIVGGVIAPGADGVELFPAFTSGAYEISDEGYLIMSRGLGDYGNRIRVNNPFHLPVVELTRR